MKNDELLDLITELKPDDAFVEEALGEQDGAPVRVYAGKRSPMRIVAPIAACLAVAAAAGVLVVNVNRGKLGFGPAVSIEESSEVDETSEPVIDEPEETKTFTENCKDIVTAELTDGLPEDAEWVEMYFDIDFDGEDELMLCPHVHRDKLSGVPGVRVFKNNGAGDVIDLGAFHLYDDSVAHFHARDYEDENGNIISVFEAFDEALDYIDEDNKKCYNFTYDPGFETHSNTVWEVFYNEETGVIEEREYLRFATTYPEDESSSTPFTDAAYRYGVEVDVKELLEEWKTIPNIPAPWVGYGKVGMIKIVDILTEMYGVSEEDHDALMRPYRSTASIYADDGKAHIAVGGIDASGSCRTQTFVTFTNCEQLRGFYIFEESNGEIKLIGAFDLEGERLETNRENEIYDLNGNLLNDNSRDGRYDLKLYDDGDESFFFYRTYHCDKEAGTEEYKLHKIVANEDGTLGDEVIVMRGTELTGDGGIRSIGQINGAEVTYAEANAEWERIMSTLSEDFTK